MNYRKEISPTQLQEMMQQKLPFQLIDVREDIEREFCNLGGDHIPLGELPRNIDKVKKDVPVVLLCHHGVRSGQALRYLENATGQSNFINLEGGIHAWSETVDPKMPRY